jgi:hypothetical protein
VDNQRAKEAGVTTVRDMRPNAGKGVTVSI